MIDPVANADLLQLVYFSVETDCIYDLSHEHYLPIDNIYSSFFVTHLQDLHYI